MPNHVDSTMKLTFLDKDAKKAFMQDFNKVDKNLCATVMPYKNIQPIDKNGNKPKGIKLGEYWADMTMPDGSVRQLIDLPYADDLWGTKWGTCEVDISFEDEYFIDMQFYTAWSPISEVCIKAVMNKYEIRDMFYTYVDECMSYSGAMKYDSNSKKLQTI